MALFAKTASPCKTSTSPLAIISPPKVFNVSPATPEDLRQHRWISTNWQKDGLRVYPVKAAQTPYTIDTKPFATCDSLWLVLELAMQDMGFALLPDIVAKPLIEKEKLCLALATHHGPEWPVSFVHPYQGEKPPQVNRFYQLIKLYLGKARPAV